MIKTYRKVATIKAEQFDGSDEMIEKYRINTDVEYYLDESDDIVDRVVPYEIETLEGDLEVNLGDWIATGVNGEHWAIADDIFKKTYVEANK